MVNFFSFFFAYILYMFPASEDFVSGHWQQLLTSNNFLINILQFYSFQTNDTIEVKGIENYYNFVYLFIDV